MAMTCGAQCAKIILIIFNVIFFCAAGAILGVGIWMLVDDNITTYIDFLATLDSESNSFLHYAAYLFIAIGSFGLLVSFFGCCGAAMENRCMLGVYIFFLAIVLIGELVAGILVAVYKGDIEDKLDDLFVEKAEMYYKEDPNEGNEQAFTEGVNVIQQKFECCGWNNYDDWENVDGVDGFGENYKFPPSCCEPKNSVTESDYADFEWDDADNENKCKDRDEGFFYDTGCKDAFIDWFEEHSIIFIGVGIGLCAVEILGFIFAICLCCALSDD